MAGIVSVLGIGSGCLVHILAATIGLYSLLVLLPFAFTAICIAGGVYLIWLGVMTIAGRQAGPLAIASLPSSDGNWQIYRQGMLSNLLNPKVALFFIAFLPQFIDPVSNLGWISFLFLGLVFFCTGSVWCFVVALGASSFADLFRGNPRVQRGFEYFTCVLFVALGVGVLVTRL